MSHSWVGIVAAVVGLGIMILVHEWGHFIMARLCGVRVVVFSIGFGNRIFGWKRGATDYRVSVFPFGGYVRMAGDNPAEERTGAPDEFLSKPRWQRLLIILAGPFMNFVLAFAVLWGLFMVGVPVPAYSHQPVQVAGVIPGSPAEEAGIKAGDKIVAIGGAAVSDWDQAFASSSIVPGQELSLGVERAGRVIPIDVSVPQDLSDGFSVLGCAQERVEVDSVAPGDPAARAGLKPDDVITSINGEPIVNSDIAVAMIKQSEGKAVTIGVRRGGKELSMTLNPAYTDPGDGGGKRWVIGATFRPGETIHEAYSFLGAAQQSWDRNIDLSGKIFSFVGGLFSGRFSLKDAAGPVGIVKVSIQQARLGAAEFIFFMAFLSVDLGILNLLPIPILDGGHVLMLAIEGSLRRDLSVAVKERFLTAGLVFLLAVIGYVTYFDILRH